MPPEAMTFVVSARASAAVSATFAPASVPSRPISV